MIRNRLDEFGSDEPKKDTELTLGPAMLVGLACVLLLLCGACFGVGYSMGRRGAAHADTAVAQTESGQATATLPAGSSTKPMAKGTIPTVQAAETPSVTSDETTTAGNPLTSYAPTASAPGAASSTVPSLVHPALPQTPAKQTETAPANGPMVQIAAVSHAEDADVLMSALRKRGYAVTERHMTADSLIHVQIGPFATRAEATAMSQKLLGDGYNAVVLP